MKKPYIKKICDFCQIEFEVKPSESSRRFCCDVHYRQWLEDQRHITRKCANPDCDETFTLSSAGDKKIYHSSSCAAQVNNKIKWQSNEARKQQRDAVKDHYNNKYIVDLNSGKECSRIYEHTKVIYSKITGQFYNHTEHKSTWHHHSRLNTAIRLSRMFNFELGIPQKTEENILRSIEQIKYLYEVELLSGAEIAQSFKITERKGYFSYWIEGAFGIKLRTQEDAHKIYFDKYVQYFGDKWQEYKRKSNFIFPLMDYFYVPGYNDLMKIGWYDSSKNIKGYARDHMFSRFEGFRQNVPPQVIAHPANCNIIPQIENSRKGPKCSITLEELYKRIENWPGLARLTC